MTMMVAELYEALKIAGVDDEKAREAAQSVLHQEIKEDLATKQFIDLRLAELENRLTWRMVGTMMAMTGLFTAVVKFF